MPSKLLRLNEVLSRIPFSKSSLFREIARGRFPRPIRVGERRVAWVDDEIGAWEEACVAERDQAGGNLATREPIRSRGVRAAGL